MYKSLIKLGVKEGDTVVIGEVSLSLSLVYTSSFSKINRHQVIQTPHENFMRKFTNSRIMRSGNTKPKPNKHTPKFNIFVYPKLFSQGEASVIFTS